MKYIDAPNLGEHITDTYITETDTTELENLSHYIMDIFIIETFDITDTQNYLGSFEAWNSCCTL